MTRRTVCGMVCAVVMAVVAFTSCNDGETYKEKRDKEIAAINNYIAEKGVKVISEATFFAQDSTTDVSKNEFVLFDASGVYMQIVRKGCGQKLRNGETATVLCRFTEYNLKLGPDSVSLTNEFSLGSYNSGYVDNPEIMSVTNTSGTFSGLFNTSTSYMYNSYSGSTSAVVLSGWLVPFAYVNLGRPANDGDEIAKVRLIVPHKQGHLSASQNVTPYLYDLTLERGR